MGRGSNLHMSVTMRSNDAYMGLPHDVFCFTMLQEMVAKTLGLELGEYYHYVGSMHLYMSDIEAATDTRRKVTKEQSKCLRCRREHRSISCRL